MRKSIDASFPTTRLRLSVGSCIDFASLLFNNSFGPRKWILRGFPWPKDDLWCRFAFPLKPILKGAWHPQMGRFPAAGSESIDPGRDLRLMVCCKVTINRVYNPKICQTQTSNQSYSVLKICSVINAGSATNRGGSIYSRPPNEHGSLSYSVGNVILLWFPPMVIPCKEAKHAPPAPSHPPPPGFIHS